MEEENDNPLELFGKWLKEVEASGIAEPMAMTVATATAEGRPSARVVLLRGFDERGFAFYTNFTSHKARELAENPHAALCFYWEEQNRQVRIEGEVEQVDTHEADAYFLGRPRGSQIAAWASKQSLPIEHPDDLVGRVAEVTKSFEGEDIPRPPFWGGYRVKPEIIEFWQRGEHRLHTRLHYAKTPNGWEKMRLYP